MAMAAQPPAQPPANPDPQQQPECAVCLQVALLPFTFPACRHTFCFTCAKGVLMIGNHNCPFCRGDVDANIFNRPAQPLDLKMVNPDVAPEAVNEEPMYWLYAGRNTDWWRYDPRTEADIEAIYKTGVDNSTFVILGKTYAINFRQMIQWPIDATSNVSNRNVRRVSSQEFDEMVVKGIAGVFNQQN